MLVFALMQWLPIVLLLSLSSPCVSTMAFLFVVVSVVFVVELVVELKVELVKELVVDCVCVRVGRKMEERKGMCEKGRPAGKWRERKEGGEGER